MDIKKLVKRNTSANSLSNSGSRRRSSVGSNSSSRRSRLSKLIASKALRRSGAADDDNDSSTSTGTSQDLTQPAEIPDIQLNLVDSDPDDLITLDEAEK